MHLKVFGHLAKDNSKQWDRANLQRGDHMPVCLKDNYSIRSASRHFVHLLHLHLSWSLIGHYIHKGTRFSGELRVI